MHIFYIVIDCWGHHVKGLKFTMPLKLIYNKNFCFNEWDVFCRKAKTKKKQLNNFFINAFRYFLFTFLVLSSLSLCLLYLNTVPLLRSEFLSCKKVWQMANTLAYCSKVTREQFYQIVVCFSVSEAEWFLSTLNNGF